MPPYFPPRAVTPSSHHHGRGLRKSASAKKKSDTSGISIEDHAPEPPRPPATIPRPPTSAFTNRQKTGRRRSHRTSSLQAGGDPNHPPSSPSPSSMSQAAAPAQPHSTATHSFAHPPSANMASSSATSTTPPAPDLSATYMPAEGDFYGGERWATAASSRPNNEDRTGRSIPNMVSPDRLPASSSSRNPSAQTPVQGSPSRRTEAGPSRTERGGSAGEGDERDKKRHKRPPSQKAMLAKALEKANHAVVLDNAQNYEQAMAAYEDACNLLHQVMSRTSGGEDKNKLDAIRSTYHVRINELKNNELATPTPTDRSEKALPEVPRTVTNSLDLSAVQIDEEAIEELSQVGNAQTAFDSDDNQRLHPRAMTRDRLPPRRQSLSPQSMPMLADQGRRDSSERPTPSVEEPQRAPSPRKQSAPVPEASKPGGDSRNLSVPMDRKYIPAPLSPRRLDQPMTLPSDDGQQSNLTPKAHESGVFAPAEGPSQTQAARGHLRTDTAGSTSWLDTIGESGNSSSSSTRSVDSMNDARYGHLRQGSGATEAEFDSALDAAIEAAYDQGFEPMSEDELHDHEPLTMADTLDSISDARKNVNRARQAVQVAEREAALAKSKQFDQRHRLDSTYQVRAGPDADFEELEPEDEERILEQMTRDHIMEQPGQFGRKNTMPRQSDASTFSGRTYGSSMSSMPTATNTPLSTVDESVIATALPIHSKKPILPPLSTSLPASGTLPGVPQPYLKQPPPPPPIPKQQPPEPPSASVLSPGVRERRLSGQTTSALKIDTTVRPGQARGPQTLPIGPTGMGMHLGDGPKSATLPRDHHEPGSSHQQTFLLHSGPRTASPFSGRSPAEPHPPYPRDVPDPVREGRSVTPASGRPRMLKKTFSSSSLKSAKSVDDLTATPLGRVFSSTSYRKENIPSMPDLPPAAPHNFNRSYNTGSMSFFDYDMHSPDQPGSPNPFYQGAPLPLEPCPEVTSLRPFWLMRCLYQTIAHPRGGYVSRRLFIPRDVWRVKNVKLRNVDEKVAQLDLLTAGLMNLSKVDMHDADAVLEVLQSFELLLDQVQGTLAKKLGGDVGPQGMSALFKGSPVVDDGSLTADPASAKDGKNKSYLSSWRKLRNKSGSGPGAGSLSAGRDAGTRDALTLKTLPMTPIMNVRFVKRDPTKILGIGPHAHYMAALGRLCDAAQIVDQIARQVEDPGLKTSSKAHVGLELSTKHAAEFFGFYVLRFALADIGMMLEKFVKRGSEWVMGA